MPWRFSQEWLTLLQFTVFIRHQATIAFEPCFITSTFYLFIFFTLQVIKKNLLSHVDCRAIHFREWMKGHVCMVTHRKRNAFVWFRVEDAVSLVSLFHLVHPESESAQEASNRQAVNTDLLKVRTPPSGAFKVMIIGSTHYCGNAFS